MMPGLLQTCIVRPFSKPAEKGSGFPTSSNQASEEVALPVKTPFKALPSLPLHQRSGAPFALPTMRADKDGRFSDRRRVTECVSSGCGHDPSSVCLSAMVNDFIEKECDSKYSQDMTSGRKDNSGSTSFSDLADCLQMLHCSRNDTEIRLWMDSQQVLNAISSETLLVCENRAALNSNHGCLKRAVMKGLQEKGYNAGFCKSRWDHAPGLTAGDYEYIDVLVVDSSNQIDQFERLIVDIDFKTQFEIARPTSDYRNMLKLLPPVFVGRTEMLKKIIDVMAEAIERSLRSQSLYVPPWRKANYLKAKWFYPYKRTCNIETSHPCREGADTTNNDGYVGIAVRSGGLDSKYTNELELLYLDATSRILSKSGAKDQNAVHSSARDRVITGVSTDWQLPLVSNRKSSMARKQGKVTGMMSKIFQDQKQSSHGILARAA